MAVRAALPSGASGALGNTSAMRCTAARWRRPSTSINAARSAVSSEAMTRRRSLTVMELTSADICCASAVCNKMR